MRHLIGILLAGVMAAVLFFAGAWGYLRLTVLTTPLSKLPPGSLLSDHHMLFGLAAVAGTGLLAGILIAAPRISPLASGLPGLVLLGLTGLYLFSVRHAVQYIPLKSRPYGAGFEAMLFDGVLALAGLAMIAPLFVPSRWRRRRVVTAPSAGSAASEDYPDMESTQTMHGDSALLSDLYRTQTRPQPKVDPDATGHAQAPWGPAEYS